MAPRKEKTKRKKPRTSICQGVRPRNPDKCKKITSCKVASGSKRTFCRKRKNTRKNKA
jgi:hypothetical protein